MQECLKAYCTTENKLVKYFLLFSKLFLALFCFVYQWALIRTFQHQLFGYKITFVNSQRKNTNSKDDFVFKNRFETLVL